MTGIRVVAMGVKLRVKAVSSATQRAVKMCPSRHPTEHGVNSNSSESVMLCEIVANSTNSWYTFPRRTSAVLPTNRGGPRETALQSKDEEEEGG